jgi:hypothetical protein
VSLADWRFKSMQVTTLIEQAKQFFNQRNILEDQNFGTTA